MVQRRPFFLTNILFSTTLCSAQAPTIDWQAPLGGSGYEVAGSIALTNDGGYIVAGSTTSADGDVTNNQGSGDCWLVKLNAAGGIQWQKTYGGTDNEGAASVLVTTDGGYLMSGGTVSFDGDISFNHPGTPDFWLVKLDEAGNLQWERCLGGNGQDGATGAALANDGGYVVAGTTFSNDGDVTNNHGNRDFWVVKLDGDGAMQWQKALGGSGEDQAMAITAANDGGFVVAGSTFSTDGDVTGIHGTGGTPDFWVVKLDSAGTLVWQKTLGGNSNEYAHAVISTNDGGYIVAGRTQSSSGDVTYNHGFHDYWVVKLDDSGAMEWQKTYGGSDLDFAYSISKADDNGFFVVGMSVSTDGQITNNHGDEDQWVVKLDNTGTLLWQKTMGGSDYDRAYSVVSLNDGGCVVAGHTQSSDGDVTGHHGNEDCWVVKLAGEPTGAADPSVASFSIVPMPATNTLSINSSVPFQPASLFLTDALGQEVKRARLSGTVCAIDVADLPRGLYLATLRTPSGFQVQRVMLE